MRRLMSVAAFALMLAVPVWAQRGGGHASGGHAGLAGGHGGGFSGGHFSSGMRSSGMRGPGVSRGFTHGPSFAQRGFSHRTFGNSGFHGRFRNRGFRNNCFGFGCRGRFFYPYAYGGYYDPYWWWDSGSSYYQNYDTDYERDRALANEMNAESLAEQRMRRQEDANDDQDVYARSALAPRELESATNQPATVLVFRDQHKQEVRNYAIVGQTLWSFASQRTEKIPLADLDLAATTKSNDDRGLTFRVPAANEAQ